MVGKLTDVTWQMLSKSLLVNIIHDVFATTARVKAVLSKTRTLKIKKQIWKIRYDYESITPRGFTLRYH